MKITEKDRDRLKKYIKRMISLTYIGVKIENSCDTSANSNGDAITEVWFTIPEKSNVKVKDFPYDVTTQEGMISAVRDTMYATTREYIEEACSEDEYEDIKNDMLKEFNESPKDYIKLYCKVREKEIWTDIKGHNAVQLLLAEIEEKGGYEEIS